MGQKTIYCYGDSNTWGFDSRSFVGERYPREIRWTGILDEKSGCRVINDGMNGRKIPVSEMPVEFLVGHVIKERTDLEEGSSLEVLIMLGTNDLLTNPLDGVRSAAKKMDWFLTVLLEKLSEGMRDDLSENMSKGWTEGRRENLPGAKLSAVMAENAVKIRLISPPLLRRGAWVETDALVEQSRLLGGELCKVAEQHQIFFTDAGAWNIPLLYDGVHFSEEGHRAFAEEILKIIL